MSVQGFPELAPPPPRSARVGVVDIAATVFPAAVQMLANHGLEFIGTLPSPGDEQLRLIVAGDALPAECETGLWLVLVIMRSEMGLGPFRTERVVEIRPAILLEPLSA